MKYLYLVFSNLKRKKSRTVLTLLSIMVAFILFGYLAAVNQAFNQGIEVAGQDRLIVRHKVSLIQMLPESYEARIEQVPGVESAIHQTWFGGVYQDPRNFFAQMPVKPAEFLDMFPEMLLPEDQLEAWEQTRSGAIAGRGIAEKYGWSIGDKIPIQGSIWPNKDGTSWEFDLVGIYDGAKKGTDTNQFFFRYDFFDESRQYGQGLVGWYTVRIADPDRAAEVAADIDSRFANSPAETKAEPEGAFVQGFANQVGNIGFIMSSIVAAVFFTILLVAGNTMAYSVRERTNELAVLKSIGFTDRSVMGLVLAESFLIVAIGGGLGLVIAWLLVAAGDPSGGALPIFFIPARTWFYGAVFIAVMSFIAGILPALQAQRLRVADALRR